MELIIILSILITYISAYIDYEHLKQNEYIENHLSRSILRALIAIVFGLKSIGAMILFSLIFWLLFDHFLNYLMKRSIFYLGSVSKIDIFFNQNIFLYICLKSIVLVLIITQMFVQYGF